MARRERSFFFNNKTGELKSKGKTLVDSTNTDNIVQLKGSITGNPVALNASGDDTNIDISIAPKGSGNVEVLGPLEILTGKRILDSAGTNVEFGDNIEMNSNKITGLGTPTANTDASTKAYVDTQAAKYLPLTGGTISSNLTVSGNFTVNGTTTTINTSTLSVADNLIDLNSDVTSGTPSQDAGIRILRGDSNAVQLRWNETNDKWELTTDGSSYANIAVISDIPTAVSELTNDSVYITDYTVTQSDVTTHQAALSITESQISDFGTYLTASDITGKLNLSGGTMSGAIAMGTNKITGMGDPTAAQDAATKAYVDSQVSSVPTGDITAVNITAGTGLSGTVSTASGDHTQTLSIDSTVATLTGSQTLTNKTLTAPVISSISNTGTLTLPTSTGTVALTSDIPNVFKTISVAGQSDVVADSNTDTLTLAAGDGLTITTNAGTDTITFTASSGDSVFSANSDFASVADSVVTSEDLDLVTASTTDTYDLGTIAVQGIVVTTSIVDGNVTTAKIADDAVTSVKLSGLTNSSSGIIQADGDGTFSIGASGISNVVDDTTPQLGGTLDTNGNDIDFGQDNKALFGGVDGDLEIYHSGSNGFIDNNDGALSIRNNVDGDDGGDIIIQAKAGENSIIAQDDAGVLLYYNNVLKLSTQSTGVNISGVADISGHVEAKGVEETVYNLGTTSGTITPNFINGAIQKITLNGNLTFSAFTSPATGQSITLIIATNGTGRTLTSTMLFAGGNKTMSTTNTTDVMTVLYDGTNYLANYVTDFS